MKIFKRACLLGILSFFSASIVSGTSAIERDIVRRYQQELMDNAKYNNYKDTHRAIQYKIDSLRTQINICDRNISECNKRIRQLDDSITSCKNKRTTLDGELASLMCLKDLGVSDARFGMSKLQRKISQNERNIEKYEYEKSECSLKLSECYSERERLEYELSKKHNELDKLNRL